MTPLSHSCTGAVTYIRKVACITCHSVGAEFSNPQYVPNCLLLPPFAFIRYLHFHIANSQVSSLHGCPLNKLSTWRLKPQWGALPLHFSCRSDIWCGQWVLEVQTEGAFYMKADTDRRNVLVYLLKPNGFTRGVLVYLLKQNGFTQRFWHCWNWMALHVTLWYTCWNRMALHVTFWYTCWNRMALHVVFWYTCWNRMALRKGFGIAETEWLCT